ncbi:hypothetical protein TNCV_551641 [Trichonephila clavipes]|nr:hypothetical protein TNCV_551641 [Trichonephila clavipes]
MVLIPQHWSLRREYSQDKSGIEKLAWKLTDFIKRDGTVNIRRSSRGNRSTRKRVRLKLRPQDNIYRDGKKRCFKRRAKSKVTIRGDKASPLAYIGTEERGVAET